MSDATHVNTRELMLRALRAGTVIPAFNIPYLPMMEPVVRALSDTGCMGLITVARLEWVKFESGSLEAVREEYERVRDNRFTRLHLDHVPVIDEDGLRVDYLSDIRRALAVGYESVMVDGSRLPLADNIAATREVVALAAATGAAVEAELGAVMGHEEGPMPSYEELFANGRGFTDAGEAARFVRETGVDWLSVAVGNLHGAISKAKKDSKKTEARLNIDHLEQIRQAAGVPLVLHGGTGIRKESVLAGVRHGIAKINIATAIRQPYERARSRAISDGQRAVYDATVELITAELGIAGSANVLAL